MRAIPTTYANTNFRSRLEARWAAFFDLLRIPWEYEPVDLNGYIPDFKISPHNGSFFVEVKPVDKVEDFSDAIDKALKAYIPDVYVAPAGLPPDEIEHHANQYLKEQCPYPFLFLGSSPRLGFRGTSFPAGYLVEVGEYRYQEDEQGRRSRVLAYKKGSALISVASVCDHTKAGCDGLIHQIELEPTTFKVLYMTPAVSDFLADAAALSVDEKRIACGILFPDLTLLWREAGNRVQWRPTRASR